jgi:hypothetical protein
MPPHQIFCTIRKTWVAALPEELIRQAWLKRMSEELNYPLNGFALEKGLHQMPHLALSQAKLPTRRADLIFFAKDIHPHHSIYPLLLVECKAIKLNSRVIHQVVGYNFYVQAPFLAIANQNEIQWGRYNADTKQFSFGAGLPSYQQLLQMLPSF